MIDQIQEGIAWSEAQSVNGYTFIPIIPGKFTRIKADVVMDDISSLQVNELDSEDVNYIDISSKNEQELFILPGMIFEGGRQTRTAVRPFTIKQGSRHRIPVNCVERNRWQYSSKYQVKENAKHFRVSGKRVFSRTKQSFSSIMNNQAGTWESIESIRQEANIDAERVQTSSHIEIEHEYISEKENEIKGLKERVYKSFSHDNQTGVVIFKGSSLYGIEAFSDPDKWVRSAEFIMNSFIVDLSLNKEKSDKPLEEINLSEVKIKEIQPIGDEKSYLLKYGELEGWGVGDDMIYYMTLDRVNKSPHYSQQQVRYYGVEESLNE